MSIGLDLDESGRLTIAAADGSPLDPRLERKVRAEHRDRLEAWLKEKCDEINGGFEQLLSIHCDTPPPNADHRLHPAPFAKPKPIEPTRRAGSSWDRVVPWRKRAREARFDRESGFYQRELKVWEDDRAAYEQDWERRRRRTEDERLISSEVMHDLLAEALGAIAWPRETLVRFEIAADLAAIHVEVDLPEIEQLPTRHAVVSERGLKLNLHDRTESQVREAYAAHIHGVVFLVVGEGFAVLPTLNAIVCSGFSQRVDPATGILRDEYLVSVRVDREEWSRIDFANLAQVDPAAALGKFELRSDRNSAGGMSAIVPLSG